MTIDESELVFTATIKAFKDKINEVVGNLDTNPTNGVQLWKDLDGHYHQTDKSSLEVQNLCNEFESISIKPNETYKQYLLRFENKVFDLTKVGAVLGTTHNIGLHFILSINQPKLFKSLIKTVNDDKGYFSNISMRDFVRKIK